jgi:hypothetical protein
MEYYTDVFQPEEECAPNVVAHKSNARKTLTEMKKENNSNFCEIKTVYNKKWNGRFLKTIEFSYYKTRPQSGSPIIHAISGDVMPGLVGSFGEDRYFKVKVSAYDEAKNGNLFYLSPEEYEKHQYAYVSEETRNKWVTKQQRIH